MKKIIFPLLMISILNLNAKEENNSFLENIITNTNDHRKDIHNYLIAMSTNLDNYVDDSRKLDISNYSSSYGLIQLSLLQDQHGSIKFDQKIKLKLKLPKLKDKFRLVFESDKIDENKNYIDKYDSNDNFNLGLTYDTLKDDIKLKAKLGLKLGSKLDPFLRLSSIKTWENIYSNINYSLGQNLKQSVVKKLESTSYMRFDKQLNDYFSLHNYSEYYWLSDHSKDSQIINSLYLSQEVNTKNYFTYSFSSYIDNIDTNLRIKRHSAKITYRHFIKKWLYLDAIPENYYDYENNFKPRYAIRFNLGMYFNKDSYK